MENVSSLRLYFTITNGKCTISQMERLNAAVAPSYHLEEGVAYSGAWIELQNASGQVLYRQLVLPFLTKDTEVFDINGRGFRCSRFAHNRNKIELIVIVPNLPDTTKVVLFHSPVEHVEQPAQKIASIPLTEIQSYRRDRTLPDPSTYSCRKVVNNGDDSLRLNIVIVAEGYRDEEKAKFEHDMAFAINSMLNTPPFSKGGISSAFNFYAITTKSNESGSTLWKIKDQIDCKGDDIIRDTFFKSNICLTSRIIALDTDLLKDICHACVPEWSSILVLVNTKEWAGTSRTWESICMSTVANGYDYIFIHELGHNIYKLADEYPYRLGCDIDTDRDRYSGAEPSQANVTIQTERDKLKWGKYVDYLTPLPTLRNPDPKKCPEAIDPQKEGTVGLYEGAYYYHSGVYRPQCHCRMRENAENFCRVCTDTIIQYTKPHQITYKPITWLSFFNESNHSWSAALRADKELPQFSDNTYDIACAGADQQLLVLLIDDDMLYFNFANYAGMFSDNFTALSTKVQGIGKVSKVACCYWENRFWIFLINDGRLMMTWYNRTNGQWENQLKAIADLTDVSSVSCTGVNTQIFVCARSKDRVFVNSYNIPTRTWKNVWTDLGNYSTGGPQEIWDMDCCGYSGQVEVLVTGDNRIWQTRYNLADHTWQSELEEITNCSKGLGIITALTCARIGKVFYVCVINNGKPFYTMRHDRKWDDSFKLIKSLDCSSDNTLGSMSTAILGGRLMTCVGLQAL